jgi:hypothetical protein
LLCWSRSQNQRWKTFQFLLSFLVGSAGATEEISFEKLEVDPDETFDVTTVMLSSSTTTLRTKENMIVGFDVVLITENVSSYLYDMLPSTALNCHIFGNIVLWRIFCAASIPRIDVLLGILSSKVFVVIWLPQM